MSLGADELESGGAPLGRVRRVGGGRRRTVDLDLGLRPALLALVEPDVWGDAMSPLRWTTKSTRHLAAELIRQGHRISADTVADVLREEGFSLQGNAKTVEGRQHRDRDGRFRLGLGAVAEGWMSVTIESGLRARGTSWTTFSAASRARSSRTDW